jgi:tRNA threonylcarbamoyladenosine biosynthesis protein TsaB
MLILGIDTATPWGTIALGEGEEIIFEISLKAGKGGGEYLLSILEQFIGKSGRKLGDLDLIAVGTGPGSYTGIRVGLAAVKGLSAGLNVPVFGMNTLRILAENLRNTSEWIAPVIDARRGEVYAALYRNTAEGIVEVDGPATILAGEFARKLGKLPQVVVCGDGSKIYQEIWSDYPGASIAPPAWDRPLASQAIRIAWREWNPQHLPLDDLTPGYLRRVEAEIRLEEKLHADKCTSDEG